MSLPQDRERREAELRRLAFDIVPQLPAKHDAACAVLRHASALAAIETSLGRDDRQLASDLLAHLPDARMETVRVLAFAHRLLCENLSQDVIVRDLDQATPRENVFSLKAYRS